jgi:hypothetical protein
MVHIKNFDWYELNKLTSIVKKKEIRYYNYPFSFDIETTSFYDGENKRACMYIWMMGINGTIVYGRTWNEFEWFIEELKTRLKLDHYNRIIVYVHNLAYEFQFLISHVEFSEVFARKRRHPIKALINDAFEFKCSYFLSGLSLEKTAENITITKIEKQVGKLDYQQIHHWKTKLTEDELLYCEYDCKILHYFILEEMGKNGNNIAEIPLTKTGYVRQYCRNYIKQHTNYKRYREKIVKEAPFDEELFILLNKAFAGGYTHANYKYLFLEIPNVHSIDFTSSYPAQMIAHKYPRGKFHKCFIESKDEFFNMINNFACVFEIKLKNVRSKTAHHIWSSSKCAYGTRDTKEQKFNAVIDNGRIVRSDEIYTYMTDVDFKNFSKFYTFDDEIAINNFWYTEYGYLPKQLIECILKFYSDKTTLKDVEDKVAEYFVSKGMVNGIYGMSVTNPVNDEIIFEDEEWTKDRPAMTSALFKAYNSINQFLVYQWGVWVTAWARYELLGGLLELNEDAIYCDTDSIKFVNLQNHQQYIDNFNIYMKDLLTKTCEYYELDSSLLHPLDIKGKEHWLGVWEYEGKYELFKTLGAKRYMTEKFNKKKNRNEIKITVSGLTNKYVYPEDYPDDKKERDLARHTPTQYILDNGGFSFFTNEMEIPKEYSRRLTHTYIDNEPYRYELTDHNDEKAIVSEYSYIHMEQSTFSMKLSDDFIEYLLGVDDENMAASREVRPELQIVKLQYEARKTKKRKKI